MKTLLRKWSMGVSYLFADDLISFYVFFTTIFAECAYLHARHPREIASAFTVVLLGYVVDVLVCSWAKGLFESKNATLVVAICYVMIAIAMFMIGGLIDIKMNIILFAIPVASAALCMAIRYFQGLILCRAIEINAQIAVVIVPWVAFAITLAIIHELPLLGKILIPAVYAICAPFIACFEDETACQNIFELAYMHW